MPGDPLPHGPKASWRPLLIRERGETYVRPLRILAGAEISGVGQLRTPTPTTSVCFYLTPQRSRQGNRREGGERGRRRRRIKRRRKNKKKNGKERKSQRREINGV